MRGGFCTWIRCRSGRRRSGSTSPVASTGPSVSASPDSVEIWRTMTRLYGVCCRGGTGAPRADCSALLPSLSLLLTVACVAGATFPWASSQRSRGRKGRTCCSRACSHRRVDGWPDRPRLSQARSHWPLSHDQQQDRVNYIRCRLEIGGG